MSVAAKEVFDLYARESWRVRAHVRIRWGTCPFAHVAARVPERGRILDVGCGHGIFSAYLALESRGREVLGIDPAEDKILAANAARAAAAEKGLHNLRFERAGTDALPGGPWDAITVVDVLYLLEPDRQKALLDRCAAILAPGGVLVVKEVADRPRWKAAWNRLQETLAVRVLRITSGAKLCFLPPSQHASWLTSQSLEVESLPLDRGYLHPHHLIVARRN